MSLQKKSLQVVLCLSQENWQLFGEFLLEFWFGCTWEPNFELWKINQRFLSAYSVYFDNTEHGANRAAQNAEVDDAVDVLYALLIQLELEEYEAEQKRYYLSFKIDIFSAIIWKY